MPDLTPLQKRTIECVVNVFETGTALGDYANVTLTRTDAGGLTYGRSQTTAPSGNLFLLLRDYGAASGNQYGEQFAPYLADLRNCKNASEPINSNTTLRGLLHAAGNDPVMHAVQDVFFDRVYFAPALRAATVWGIHSPLGVLTVYDSIVQGSFWRMALRTSALVGRPSATTETGWIATYVKTRRAWLAGRSGVLATTVYRMDALRKLISMGNWSLSLPVLARDVMLTTAVMGASGTLSRVPVSPPPPVSEGDTVILGGASLGIAWLNAADGRNYFPVRLLLERLYGNEAATRLSLVSSPGSVGLSWDGHVVAVPCLMRAGVLWGQVAAFATWQGLGLTRDPKAGTLALHR